MFKTINGYEHGVFYISSIKKDVANKTLIFYLMNGGSIKAEYDTETEMEETYQEFLNVGLFTTINDRVYNTIHFSTVSKSDIGGVPGVHIVIRTGETLNAEFDTEAERDEFYDLIMSSGFGGLIQKDTYSDFPTTGSTGCVYLAKDTGQTYYWDKVAKKYVTTGTSGRTGVYTYNGNLSATIGDTATINKSDLTEILKPSVPFMEGSEVIAGNSVHAIITKINSSSVEVTTITDLTIDSFKQVADLTHLPTTGIDNVLYYVADIDEFRIWDSVTSDWQEPFHPIIFNENPNIATAKLNTLYVDGPEIKYTTDNIDWIYLGGVLTKQIVSNTDCGAAPKGTTFAQGMSFTDFAEKILRKIINPTTSFSASNSGNKAIGTSIASTTMTLNITNLADVTETIDRIEFYVGSTLVNTKPFVTGQSSYSYTYNTNPIETNTTVKGRLVYNTSSNVDKTADFKFYDYYYAGKVSVDPASVTEAIITAFSTKGVSTAKGYTYNNVNLSNERFCYAYPASYGNLASIKDGNGFENFPSYTKTTVNITNAKGTVVAYNVYTLTDPVTGTGFKQIYS